jgi:hypothetical protein
MRHFCLMTSENYIAKSILMYESLLNHYNNEFRLYYFCFDNQTYNYLLKANYNNIIPIARNEWEDAELLKVKSSRSTTEYFFTTTGSLILYVFKEFKVDMCIYLDADLYFFSSPEILIDEMGDKSIMITEHRYADQKLSKLHGKYCIQFMPVRNDQNGNIILNWWRNACLQWCYLRSENGLWADQGYLNDWPTRFRGVHELQHLGGGVAPWNAPLYKLYRTPEGVITLVEKRTLKKFSLIYFHFHGVRFFSNNYIYFENQSFDKVLMKYIYRFYFKQLILTAQKIKVIDELIEPLGILPTPPFTWRKPFHYVKRKLNKKLITDLKY